MPGPIKAKSARSTQKFIQAANMHETEIHTSFRRRKGKTHARASLGMQETVLEFMTRKRW